MNEDTRSTMGALFNLAPLILFAFFVTLKATVSPNLSLWIVFSPLLIYFAAAFLGVYVISNALSYHIAKKRK